MNVCCFWALCLWLRFWRCFGVCLRSQRPEGAYLNVQGTQKVCQRERESLQPGSSGIYTQGRPLLGDFGALIFQGYSCSEQTCQNSRQVPFLSQCFVGSSRRGVKVATALVHHTFSLIKRHFTYALIGTLKVATYEGKRAGQLRCRLSLLYKPPFSLAGRFCNYLVRNKLPWEFVPKCLAKVSCQTTCATLTW